MDKVIKHLNSRLPHKVMFIFKYHGFWGGWVYLFRKISGLKKKPTKRIYEQFIQQLYQDDKTRYSKFEEQTPLPINADETSLSIYTFYLPQYHECDVNNNAWGKGFTEWTNVTRAKPQFLGHYQPKLPADLGFYNLLNPDVIKKQIQMAQHHGITGFCFHYYWFSGVQLLLDPVKIFMDNCPKNFKFMINWANENWTKRWDGLDQEVILANKADDFDTESFFKDLLPILRHPQYRMFSDNTPWLVIYRPSIIKEPKKFAAKLRNLAKKNGFKDLHLSMCLCFDQDPPEAYGFDSAIEFPPHGLGPLLEPQREKINLVNPNFEGQVYDCTNLAEKLENRYLKSTTKSLIFPCAFPSWDNEARKPGKGHSFINISPQNFLNWLTLISKRAPFDGQNKKCIFINAWNEWAEGAYLEPDKMYGYSYLNRVNKVANIYKKNSLPIEIEQRKETSVNDCAIAIHLFYPEMAKYFANKINDLEYSFDIYITYPEYIDNSGFQTIRSEFPNAEMLPVSNRGRDILPFFKLLKEYDLSVYKAVCKIHSKKSPHRKDGELWLDLLVESLLGTSVRIPEIIEQISLKGIGALSHPTMVCKVYDHLGSNERKLKDLASKLNIPLNKKSTFIAGSMYWASNGLIRALSCINLKEIDFEFERGQIDGTTAHSMERLLGAICEMNKLTISEISDPATTRFKIIPEKKNINLEYGL